MKKLINIIIILSAIIFASCTEEIDIDVGETASKVVIFGTITTDTMAHQIKVSKSANYFSNAPTPRVSGAEVVLTDDKGNTEILTESSKEAGIYETRPDFYGVVGNKYVLTVNVEGKEYAAESYINPVNEIDFIRLKYNDMWEGWEVKVWAWDNEEYDDYYMFKAYRNGVLITDTISEWWTAEDEFFNGGYTNGIMCQFFQDEYPDEKLETGDTITFEIDGITEDFYYFVLEVQEETGFSDPMFSGPPANISTNIKGGALGFFSAYSLRRASYVIKEEDWEWRH